MNRIAPDTRPERVAETALIVRVLVVDDSAGQRAVLSRLLARWGFEVSVARDAFEALEVLARAPQDIVLSDWMMPGLDGLEFCRRVRGLAGGGFAYFILLTSKSEKAEVARGLDAGADDFLSKPVNADELRARISAGMRIVTMQRELAEKNHVISATLAELQTAHDAIERDLRQARRIQQALVPDRARAFGDTSVSLLFKPCGHVGGDLVGMFAAGEDQLGLYAIDVSGHGITSAMVTARVAGYLNPAWPDHNLGLERSGAGYALRAPVDVVASLNERLAADPGVDEYLTMIYATLDRRSGALGLVQAGHPSPLLMTADGGARFLGSGGLPVGLVAEASHEPLQVTLAAGDRLLLYSDGFVEAVRRDGSMLGEDGLLELAQRSRARSGTDFLDALFGDLKREMPAHSALDDDVSAALLEYSPPAAERAAAPR